MGRKLMWWVLPLLVVALVGYWWSAAGQAAVPLPGSDADPVVTKSYVDQYLEERYTAAQQQLQQMATQVAQLTAQVQELKGKLRLRITLRIGQRVALVGNLERTLDVAPFVQNGVTMLPFRFIGETLGAQVGWIETSQTVTFRRGDTLLSMGIGAKEVMVNGQPVALDVPAQLVGGVTVVPARVVSELLGASVQWQGETQTVVIMP